MNAPHHRSTDTGGTGLMSPDGVSPAPAPDLAALLDEIRNALIYTADVAADAMRQANYDGANWDINEELRKSNAAISRIDAVRKEKP